MSERTGPVVHRREHLQSALSHLSSDWSLRAASPSSNYPHPTGKRNGGRRGEGNENRNNDVLCTCTKSPQGMATRHTANTIY